MFRLISTLTGSILTFFYSDLWNYLSKMSEVCLDFLCFVSTFVLLANHISNCFCFKWETLLASWSKHFKILTTQNPLLNVYLLYEWIFFYVVLSRVWVTLCVFLNSFPVWLSLFSLKPPRFSLFFYRRIVHWHALCLFFLLLFFFFNL